MPFDKILCNPRGSPTVSLGVSYGIQLVWALKRSSSLGDTYWPRRCLGARVSILASNSDGRLNKGRGILLFCCSESRVSASTPGVHICHGGSEHKPTVLGLGHYEGSALDLKRERKEGGGLLLVRLWSSRASSRQSATIIDLRELWLTAEQKTYELQMGELRRLKIKSIICLDIHYGRAYVRWRGRARGEVVTGLVEERRFDAATAEQDF